ncbi:MAG: hypothetical protein ACTSW1_08395 [Candidatus Hodarchaeales archaeon]
MKKVVCKTDPLVEISVEKIDSEKFYGLMRNDGQKALLIRFDCTADVYKFVINLRTGNAYNGVSLSRDTGVRSFQSIMKNFVKDPYFTVYEFDTQNELLQWMMED